MDIDAKQVYELMHSWPSTTEEEAEFVDNYVKEQLMRFVQTLRSIPQAAHNSSRLLDVGGLANMIPCYQQILGYRNVAVSTRDKESPFVTAGMEGVEIAFFDAEFDQYPFRDGTFDTVVCLEVVEHLTVDPMRMMAEINRVLKPGGSIVMTTPNVIAWKVLGRIVEGRHPSGWSYYSGYHSDRHNREYTPQEMGWLLRDGGFGVTELTTFSQSGVERAHRWLKYCLLPLRRFWEIPADNMRGDYILAAGRKEAGVRNRLPDWLYGGYKEDRALLDGQSAYQELKSTVQNQ